MSKKTKIYKITEHWCTDNWRSTILWRNDNKFENYWFFFSRHFQIGRYSAPIFIWIPFRSLIKSFFPLRYPTYVNLCLEAVVIISGTKNEHAPAEVPGLSADRRQTWRISPRGSGADSSPIVGPNVDLALLPVLLLARVVSISQVTAGMG